MPTVEPRRVLVVMGTRPEVVKLAPVIRALESSARLEPVVCVTGQHQQLLEQTLREFDLVPDIRLAVMRAAQTPSGTAARLMDELPRVYDEVRPGTVVVQGDTTTAFAAGLSAFYQGTQVAHVEAGLRTGDMTSPFPEEANRRMLAAIAAMHFSPTPRARQNLLDEGVPADRVWLTGNTVIDALGLLLPALVVPAAQPKRDREVLVTAHRRESLGGGLAEVGAALRILAGRHPDIKFTWVLHPNPAVRAEVLAGLAGAGAPNLVARDPLPYGEFIRRLAGAALVLTDSGGIQEEAPALGVPVLVLGEKTARTEGVCSGAAHTTALCRDAVVAATEAALARPALEKHETLYGDGFAAARIVEVLSRISSGEVRVLKHA